VAITIAITAKESGSQAAPTNKFYMTTQPVMPQIELTAALSMQSGPPPVCTWSFNLEYANFITTVPGSRRRAVRTKKHPTMPNLAGNPVLVPLTELMCGTLTVTVAAMVNGQRVVATRSDILIGGNNPTPTELRSVVNLSIVRKMILQESNGMQFNDPVGGTWRPNGVNPNWSSDNLRGVGLGQLTNPPPADGDIWNWRTNALHLQARFQQKRAPAATLHTRVMASTRFRDEAKALADWRAAEGLPRITPKLPILTNDQQDCEALRAYNGYGRQVTGQYLAYIHEFEPRTEELISSTRKDSNGIPLRSPRVLAADSHGNVAWVQVSGAERRLRSGGSAPGDPEYVKHVLAQRV
jgi:hypothetical protein